MKNRLRREIMDDTVIIQVAKNNHRMDGTKEVMTKYDGVIQRLEEQRGRGCGNGYS